VGAASIDLKRSILLMAVVAALVVPLLIAEGVAQAKPRNSHGYIQRESCAPDAKKCGWVETVHVEGGPLGPKPRVGVGEVQSTYVWLYSELSGERWLACRSDNTPPCTIAADLEQYAKIRLDGRRPEWSQRIDPWNNGGRTFHFTHYADCRDGNGSGLPTTSCGSEQKECNDPFYRATQCGWGPSFVWGRLEDNDDYWVHFQYKGKVNCACWYDGFIFWSPSPTASYSTAHFKCYNREASPCEFP
jgi:hypothetical protein